MIHSIPRDTIIAVVACLSHILNIFDKALEVSLSFSELLATNPFDMSFVFTCDQNHMVCHFSHQFQQDHL